jgi:AbrB family looped-hinge helix DNA binding protein
METTLSSKGQIVLPAAARRRLRLEQGERLAVEFRDGGVLLRPMNAPRAYRLVNHPVSGLPVMVPVGARGRLVTAAEIAKLNAELL